MGGHIRHGQNAVEARNKMMRELIEEFKLQQLQSKVFDGLECDSYADYAFIIGDLNYRINGTHTEITAQPDMMYNLGLE